MQTSLLDPQFLISAFIAVAAPFLVYLLEKRDRARKHISYDVVSVVSLLRIKDEIRSRVKVYIDDKLTEDIYIVVISIINSGNIPIVKSDYERPINISFGNNSQLISADVVAVNRDSLHPDVYIYDEKVYVEPILLNEGDVTTLKVLLSRFEGEVLADARIVGVKSIEQYNTHAARSSVVMFFGLILTTVGIALGILSIDTIFNGWPIWTMIIVGILITVYGTYHQTIYIYTDEESYTKHRLGGK